MNKDIEKIYSKELRCMFIYEGNYEEKPLTKKGLL